MCVKTITFIVFRWYLERYDGLPTKSSRKPKYADVCPFIKSMQEFFFNAKVCKIMHKYAKVCNKIAKAKVCNRF